MNKSQKNIILQKKFVSILLSISILLSGSVLVISPDVKPNKSDVKSNTVNKYKRPLIIAGSTIISAFLILLGLKVGVKAIANSCIFPGIYMNPNMLPAISDRDNTPLYHCYNDIDCEIGLATRRCIHTEGRLYGCSHKLNNPVSDKLRDKCVIVFGPNAGTSPSMINSFPLKALLKQGATVVTIDYGGYGHSYLDKPAVLHISQKTIYSNGETIYRYVLENLKYAPKDVIIFGFSLGGSVASHVADYSSKRKETLAGLILASPINSLYGIAADMTSKPLAAIARAITKSELNTVENLRNMENKDIPLFLCSGDKYDFLSLKKTLIHQELKEFGFNNILTNIAENCGHNDLNEMFGSDKETSESMAKFNEYINNQLAS